MQGSPRAPWSTAFQSLVSMWDKYHLHIKGKMLSHETITWFHICAYAVPRWPRLEMLNHHETCVCVSGLDHYYYWVAKKSERHPVFPVGYFCQFVYSISKSLPSSTPFYFLIFYFFLIISPSVLSGILYSYSFYLYVFSFNTHFFTPRGVHPNSCPAQSAGSSNSSCVSEECHITPKFPRFCPGEPKIEFSGARGEKKVAFYIGEIF